MSSASDENAVSVNVEFAPEKHLDSRQVRKALLEHNIYQPNTVDDAEHVPVLTLDALSIPAKDILRIDGHLLDH